jgi:hypothetical protein
MRLLKAVAISILISSFVFVTLKPGQASAVEASNKMKTFLTSCAYGTAAGALVGLGTLAFASDPGSSVGNIARGASLGLYAGIGVGIYLNTEDQEVKTSLPESTQQKSTAADNGFWAIAPIWNNGKVAGAELNFLGLRF